MAARTSRLRSSPRAKAVARRWRPLGGVLLGDLRPRLDLENIVHRGQILVAGQGEDLAAPTQKLSTGQNVRTIIPGEVRSSHGHICQDIRQSHKNE